MDTATVAEGDNATTITVTATVDHATIRFDENKTVAVSVDGSGGTGVVGFAVVATNVNITITAGQATGTSTFTLTPADNNVDETNETVTVSGTLAGVTVNSATVTITDNDATPSAITLSVDADTGTGGTQTTVAEGGGAKTVEVTARITSGTRFATAQTVTVTVGASSDAAVEGTDYATVAAQTITISAGTASGSTTFTLTPTDDSFDEPTQTLSITGGGLAGVTFTNTSVGITDNDATPEIDLSVDTATVGEGEGATTITVTATVDDATIRFDEAKTVRVSVAGSGNNGVVGFTAVDPFDVTITAGAVSGSATFSLAPVDDNVDGPNETVTVSGTLAGVTVTSATVSLTDDDSVGFTITQSSGSTSVTENGGTDTYTVKLNTQPTATVAIQLSVTGPVTLSTRTIAFLPSTWNSAQTITVTGVNDNLDNTGGSRTATITHDVSAQDAKYHALPNRDITVTVTDDDAAPSAITLSVDADTNTGGTQTTVGEGGGAKTVEVTATITSTTRFATDQTVTVTVGANSDAAVEGTDYATVAAQTITITAGATSGSTTFTLTPTDDSFDEPTQTLSITGGGLAGVTFTDTSVGITDNDATPEIDLSVDTATVGEGDGATTITVTATVDDATIRFDEAKTVRVSVAGSGNNGVVGFTAVDPFDVTITAGAVSGSATFSLVPTVDSVDGPNETVTVSGTLAGVTVTSATVSLTDDDSVGFTITQTSGSTSVAENGGTDTYTVRLNTQPTATVSIDLSVTGPVTLSSSTLEFTTATWNSAQTITVTGSNDNLDNTGGSRTATITHDVSAGDAKYLALPDRDITVTVTDDDATPAINLVAPTSSVAENGGSVNTLVIARVGHATTRFDVAKTVRVTLTGPVGGEFVDFTPVNAFNITIGAGAASGQGRFVITPTNDNINERDATITVSGTSSGLTVNSGTFTLTDDEADPTLTQSVPSVATITEGSSAQFRVNATVASSFAITVNVAVSESNNGDYVSSTNEGNKQVTLPAGDTQVSYSVPTVQDDTDEVDGSVTLVLRAGTDYLLGSTNTSRTVSVEDDDETPGVAVDLSVNNSGNVVEGAMLTVTATLAETAAANVVIPVRAAAGGTAVAGDYSLSAASITVLSGETTGTLTLTATDDAIDEPAETLRLELGTLPTGYSPGTTTSVEVSIGDNDPTAVTLSRSPGATAVEGTTVTYTVALGRALSTGESLVVPLTFSTGSGTATRGTDYTLACPTTLPTGVTCANLNSGNAAVTFTGGDAAAASVNIVVTLIADGVSETSSETINIGLGSLGSGATGVDNAGVLTVEDPTATTVTLTVSGDGEVIEGDTLTLTVSLVPAATANVTIGLRAAAGSTATADDYTLAASVTIASGSSSGTVMFTAVRDDVAEDSGETLVLELGTLPVDYVAGDPDSVTITIADPDPNINADGTYNVAADWVLLPSGIRPGETFRLLFKTSTRRNAEPDDIAVYDAHVQTAAAAGHTAIAGHASLYKVVGSTSTVNARDHALLRATDIVAPIFWLNGPRVSQNYSNTDRVGFWARRWENWRAADRRDESGNQADTNWAFTGTQWTGIKASSYPLGVTANNLVVRGRFQAGANDVNPIQHLPGLAAKTAEHSFYAISPVYRVESDIPLPVAGTAESPVVSVLNTGANTITEGNTASFTVTASPAPTDTITVRLRLLQSQPFGARIVGGTTITLTQSTPSAAVAVTTVDDRWDHPNGSITLVVLEPATGSSYRLSHSSGAPSAQQVFITDNDPESANKISPRYFDTDTKQCRDSYTNNIIPGGSQACSSPPAGYTTAHKDIEFVVSKTDFTLAEGESRYVVVTFSRTPDTGTDVSNIFRAALQSDQSRLGPYECKTFPGVGEVCRRWGVHTPWWDMRDFLDTTLLNNGRLNSANQLWVRVDAKETDTAIDGRIAAQVYPWSSDARPWRGGKTPPVGASVDGWNPHLEDINVYTEFSLRQFLYGSNRTAWHPTLRIGARVLNNDSTAANLIVTPNCSQPGQPCFTINEGSQRSYTIELPQQPQPGATYTVTPVQTNKQNRWVQNVNFNPPQLQWTHNNWSANRKQTITVTAPADNDIGSGTFVITHRLAGFPNNTPTKNTAITAHINDTDVARLVMKNSDGELITTDHTITLEPGGNDYYTVELSHDPLGSRTLWVRSQHTNNQNQKTPEYQHPVSINRNSPQTVYQPTYVAFDRITFYSPNFTGTTRDTNKILWNQPQKIYVTAWTNNNNNPLFNPTCRTDIDDCWTITNQYQNTNTHNINININTPPPENNPPPENDPPPNDPPPATDPVVSITADNNNITEGANATFTLTATPPPTTPLTVTVNITATGNYGITTGQRTVTIPTTGTTTLTIPTTNDTTNEPNGTITVTITNQTTYTPDNTNSTATTTITDNDNPTPNLPVLTVTDATYTEGTRGGYYLFYARLNKAPTTTATVKYRIETTGTGTGHATAGTDFTPATRTITFRTGNTQNAGLVIIKNDSIKEPDETLRIVFFNPQNITLTKTTATITIKDND